MTGRERLLARYADYDALTSAVSLLNWDRQVLMPPAGAEARTAHVGRLTRLAHVLLTGDEMRSAHEAAAREAEPGSEDAAVVRVVGREIESQSKLPLELVERKSAVSSDAYEVWKVARAESDFSRLAPYLEQLFDIARETAELLGYTDHIYDPLIDMFEEGATYSAARSMFETIKRPIVSLVAEIRERGTEVDDHLLYGDWDKSKLRDFAQGTAARIGFDFERGRLDVAPNAFCTNMASADVRMTTRASNHIRGIVSSSLHEMGHGLYEQGSQRRWDRTPLAGGISLAVHESQSRLWENIIGRSRGFWQFFLPDLQKAFPSLSSLDPDQFYRAYSKVDPTFIRVGSDELTYNLHILVRFELEVEILTGKLLVKDLPAAWNAKYESYLGITPPNDGLGCLQDVHWSRGTIGYFPTYAMGNLIGGQIWARLQDDLGDAEPLLGRGDFAPVLGWLQDRIYSQGRLFPPAELVQRVTGSPMKAEPWLDYAKKKFGLIYDLS